jgi:metallo-beta-lactamase class B
LPEQETHKWVFHALEPSLSEWNSQLGFSFLGDSTGQMKVFSTLSCLITACRRRAELFGAGQLTLLCLVCFLSVGYISQSLAKDADSDWYTPRQPCRLVGNVYYVGTSDLAEYLITTSQGHILINSNFERTVPLLRSSVETLGFQMKDIKILLTSHAHADHAAGHAMIRKLTGAKVMVMEGDAEVIQNGGAGIKACPVDRVLRDGEEIKLGEATLVAHRTAGHTKGCTTWALMAQEGGKSYQVVIVGSPNVNPGYILVNNREYPDISEDYKRTFQTLKALPCDVFLGAHGSYFDLEDKSKRPQKGGSNPFIDPEGYRSYIAEREQAFLRELAKQQKEAAGASLRR